MICPDDLNYPERGMKIEKTASSVFRTSSPYSDVDIKDKKKPQILNIPGKNNFFMVYDFRTIETIKTDPEYDCVKNKRPKVHEFRIDHKYACEIVCHAVNWDHTDDLYQNDENTLIALAYNDGTVHMFHPDELEQENGVPCVTLKVQDGDGIVDMKFI